jgi:Tfp pilus assembly protein PilE
MTNQQIAEKYLEARKAYKEAEAILAEAKLAVEQAFASSDTKRVETKDGVVSVITVNNRTFDVMTLKNLVSADVFGKVTEVKVDPKAFTKAETNGEITDDVISQVVKFKPHNRIEVGEVLA